MKPMKLTSLMVMLLVGFSAAAQEEFFDDVYFSSSKKIKRKTEEKVIQPKEDAERTTMTSTYSTSKRKSAVSDEERDVDEYNRRYTSVDVEEPYDEDSDGEILAEYNDDMDNEKLSLPILKGTSFGYGIYRAYHPLPFAEQDYDCRSRPSRSVSE